ncbi:hypothetical protein [Citrobacter portucalensis]|uniref:hypothetical protein n=1 Tax=Citrobacter portucalensis TaxID=1639133 RepID=UPI002877084C|nr:hypothetical protein [Citrobacter portucalensis]MDS0976221.1 hypothetical protein [Citrobacter portucalensis]MEB0982850.1 hypothetical protein [Citrobacter portucalensis]
METETSVMDKTVLDIDKVGGALKSDVETVLASLSKEEYKAAMKALSNGKFSMKIPPAS